MFKVDTKIYLNITFWVVSCSEGEQFLWTVWKAEHMDLISQHNNQPKSGKETS